MPIDRFGGAFLAGSTFSAVDAFYAPVVFRLRTYGFTLPGAARGYASRMLKLAGMQCWEADALVEPWREAGHEREIAALGECLEDLRR